MRFSSDILYKTSYAALLLGRDSKSNVKYVKSDMSGRGAISDCKLLRKCNTRILLTERHLKVRPSPTHKKLGEEKQ